MKTSGKDRSFTQGVGKSTVQNLKMFGVKVGRLSLPLVWRNPAGEDTI